MTGRPLSTGRINEPLPCHNQRHLPPCKSQEAQQVETAVTPRPPPSGAAPGLLDLCPPPTCPRIGPHATRALPIVNRPPAGIPVGPLRLPGWTHKHWLAKGGKGVAALTQRTSSVPQTEMGPLHMSIVPSLLCPADDDRGGGGAGGRKGPNVGPCRGFCEHNPGIKLADIGPAAYPMSPSLSPSLGCKKGRPAADGSSEAFAFAHPSLHSFHPPMSRGGRLISFCLSSGPQVATGVYYFIQWQLQQAAARAG